MNRTGFLFDKRYLLHRPGSFHPEVPERLEAIHRGIKDAGLLSHLVPIDPHRADRKWIESAHDGVLIDRLRAACEAGQEIFDDADNQICSETFETAMLAVGGVIDATRMVMEGKIDNAFCAVRPPGHHAEQSRAMGFCYFNNIAIAAKYLQIEWHVNRIGIIDFDVHHGNGTQQIFEEDPTVFYYSIHEHPSFAYPGTGRFSEQGKGKGVGFTKNSPVLPGKGDMEYTRLIKRDLLPAFEEYQPEVILVSTGFDAHSADNLAGIRLSTEWFSWMMKEIIHMAQEYAEGRVVSVLEGGYAIEHLPELAKNHVETLLGSVHP
jgi:acetoin utilization deacetylase AcuC-like enzyme